VVGNCILLYQATWLTAAMRLVSLPGDGVWLPVMLTIMAAIFIYKLRGDKFFAAILLVAPLVGNVVKSALKTYYAVPRPASFGCEVLAHDTGGLSFPSGHTVYYTIFFGLLAYYSWKNRKELWAQILLVVSIIPMLLIGYSRVYLGAHWYLDVFAGYIIGGVILAITILVYEYSLSRPNKGTKNV